MEKALTALQRIRNLVQRTAASSPFQEDLPPPSTGGLLFHRHLTSPPGNPPPKYAQFCISSSGKLVSYCDPPIGHIVCTCRQESHDPNSGRFFSFVRHVDPVLLSEEHVVSSKIVLQSLTQSQLLSSDCSYLFFRLDGNEPQSLDDLQRHIEGHLRSLTAGVENEYESLYLNIFEATAPPLSQIESPGPSQAVPRNRTSSNNSDARSVSPPQGNTSTSKKSALHFAILIYSSNRSILNFSPPQQNYISEAANSQLVEAVNEGIRKTQSPGLVVYINRDLENQQTRYQICAATLSESALSRLPLTYQSQKCEGIVYTVIPLKFLPQNETQQTFCKALSPTLKNESLYRWFRRVVVKILEGSLFQNCGICNATFQEEAQMIRHTQKTHNDRDSSSDSDGDNVFQLLRPGQTPQRRDNDVHHDQQDHRHGHHHQQIEHHQQQVYPTPLSTSRSEGRSGHLTFQPKGQQLPTVSILSKEVYVPDFLGEYECPREYTIFWELKGHAQPPPFKEKNAKTKWICPKFPRQVLALEKVVNYPSLLEEETLAWAKVYQYMFRQETFASIEKVDILQIHCYNDPNWLQASGRSKIFEELRKAAPTLEAKSLQNLSESALETFFFQSRMFILSHHIPCEAFPEYILTPQSMGNDIYNRIRENLAGYPEYRMVLRRFSCYLESIIRSLLPAQEPYSQTEQRIISEHRVHLLSSRPSVDYTRTKLHADASELLTRSPYYIQTRDTMTIDQKRSQIDALKVNLLSKIVAQTPFEADLYRLVTMDTSYRKLEELPFQVLLDRLANLILADQRGDVAQANAVRWSARSSITKPARESRKLSTSPPPNPSSSRRSKSRSKSPHQALQPICDTCNKFGLPEEMCKMHKHCRIKGHQLSFKGKPQFYQAFHTQPSDVFILKDHCPKCASVVNAAEFKWMQNAQSTQSANQLAIPPSFFQAPFQLHPQSEQDISTRARNAGNQGRGHQVPPGYSQPPPNLPNTGRTHAAPDIRYAAPEGQGRTSNRANSPRQ